MVSLGWMRSRALANSEHTVGLAFCRALGVEPARRRGRAACRARRAEGLMECFRNERSPMDGRIRQ